MMKWGKQKSLCTSRQWKAPHTHPQAMWGIIKIAGDFRSFRLSLLQGMRVFESFRLSLLQGMRVFESFRLSLLQGMRVFESTGPVFNQGCILASLTKIFDSDAKSNYRGVILMQQRLPHIIYTSTSKAAVYLKNKKGVLTSLK